ncbi:myb-like DNA-binding domain containing protein, putative [Babesia bigemina]|uniref:Myb-like DNA-binding domain containing protein, putative n=1 Tax=Babesia bigemina TaxID=5866 RepID=A0A061D2B2_BABBI|nr:myb-like DNA-binding domain containing protein, putative [Babesia bigemina]CDR94896.1 myb-like DNA-binding domain containing protein, putative [Babesia bigemina]|eukprot:XP_012767082.1 myb-like DNA-binding domain containing protein, putative [Babesia bigemina]
MDRRDVPRGTPASLECMSPSLSLLRLMSGINHRAHELFMNRLSQRSSDKSVRSPMSRGYGSRGRQSPRASGNTIMAPSPRAALNTTDDAVTSPWPKRMHTPQESPMARTSGGSGSQGVADTAQVGSTATPTRKQDGYSLLSHCRSSSSSLRFNPASLVSLPFGYCNNTFVKIRVDDVIDPRVGRKRTKRDYSSSATATQQQPARRGSRQAAVQAPSLAHMTDDEDLLTHYEYSSNPYKRRYCSSVKYRRRTERIDTGGGEDGMQAVHAQRHRQQRPYTRKTSEHADVGVEEQLPEVSGAESGTDTEDILPVITPATQAPLPLHDQDRGHLKNMESAAKRVKREMVDQMMDVVQAVSVVKKRLIGKDGDADACPEQAGLPMDSETLAQLEDALKSLVRETRHNIVALQYSKLLLNWHYSPDVVDGVKQTRENSPGRSVDITDDAENGNPELNDSFSQYRGVVTASPCITFSDGLACVQGLCSTSKQSFEAQALTDCYTAAGCYVWEHQNEKVPEGKLPNDGKHCTGDLEPSICKVESADAICNINGASATRQIQPSDYAEGAEYGEALEESDEEGLGKTGPWTSDPDFAKSILDSNLKAQFNAYAGFLKDVCHSAIAEVRIPRPEWVGSSEHSCNNDMCCPRCCTCKDTCTTEYKRTKHSGSSNANDAESLRFEVETALARTDMLASMLGKCVCFCNCLSDRRLIDRVIHDNSKNRRQGNSGIVWHDMECPENMLDAEYPNLPREGVLQERFTLRIKAEHIPLSWKQRSPFVCKLDIITDAIKDDVHSNETPDHTDCGKDMPSELGLHGAFNTNNPSDGHTISQPLTCDGGNLSGGNCALFSQGSPDTYDRNANPEGITQVEDAPMLKLKEFKDLSSFTLWDAVDTLAKEQRELHRILRKNEFTDCFDALEIDVSQLTREKLKLSSECLIDDPNSEDYVEIALYLPYAPSCIMPWRFESIDTLEIMSQRFKRAPRVEVHRSYGVLEDLEGMCPPDSDERTQSEDIMLDECIMDRSLVMLHHLDELVSNTPTNVRVYDDVSSNSGAGTLVESSATPYADDASTIGTDTSSPTIIKDFVDANTNGDSETLACSELLRDMVVVPLCVKRVLQVMREHILVRNEILNAEAHACKLYKRRWHHYLRRMKAAAPKVDDFAWGVLPVRALDEPNNFVPLPAGFKQNDINWPYITNNVLSPFEVNSYGIGDICNQQQRFSTLAQNARDDKEMEMSDYQQIHTTRKPNAGRRRLGPEAAVTDNYEDDGSRAPVWLAPSYSNLTGPGLRWTYSCMDTLSDPLHCIPNFKTVPIYQIMTSPDYNYYKLDHCVQYDRRNSLPSEAVLAEEINGRISNVWTRNECRIFVEKYLMYPKNFAKIAQFIENKTCGDCVSFYYKYKYRLKLKERINDMKSKPKNKYDVSRFVRRDAHVMQAIDSILDDCYTDSVKSLCEQNSFAFTTVNDHLLSTAVVDNVKPYDVALTEHRGNWSPMEDSFQLMLDNLNEGYFVPTKFRCLTTRKNMQLPLKTMPGDAETTLRRGCLIMNGCRDFGDPQQLSSVMSAVKTDHFMSLKPICSKKVAGRSVLEAVMQDTIADQQRIDTRVGANVMQFKRRYSATLVDGTSDMEDTESHDMNYADDSEQYDSPSPDWNRAEDTPEYSAEEEEVEDSVSEPVTPQYETQSDEENVQDPMGYDAYDSNVEESYQAMDESHRSSGYPINAPAFTAHQESRTSHVVENPRWMERSQLQDVHVGNYDDGESAEEAETYNPTQAPQRTVVDWSEKEVAAFVRLYRIYGEDWDIIESQMARYGRTKEDIINYYIARLTTNALKRDGNRYQGSDYGYDKDDDGDAYHLS